MTGRRPTAMTPGLLIEVPLGDGTVGYGRLLLRGRAEFFALRVAEGERPPPADITAAPKLFVISLMMDILRRSDWRPLEVLPLTDDEAATVHVTFKQDLITGALSLYWDEPDGSAWHERPATVDEVQGLERTAGWSANHVQDRLRDHFNGVPNKWVRSLAPKPI